MDLGKLETDVVDYGPNWGGRGRGEKVIAVYVVEDEKR